MSECIYQSYVFRAGVHLPSCPLHPTKLKEEIEKEKDMYEIAIIQLSGKTYFWVLKKDRQVIASSQMIGEKYEVENEAQELATYIGVCLSVEERE